MTGQPPFDYPAERRGPSDPEPEPEPELEPDDPDAEVEVPAWLSVAVSLVWWFIVPGIVTLVVVLWGGDDLNVLGIVMILPLIAWSRAYLGSHRGVAPLWAFIPALLIGFAMGAGLMGAANLSRDLTADRVEAKVIAMDRTCISQLPDGRRLDQLGCSDVNPEKGLGAVSVGATFPVLVNGLGQHQPVTEYRNESMMWLGRVLPIAWVLGLLLKIIVSATVGRTLPPRTV